MAFPPQIEIVKESEDEVEKVDEIEEIMESPREQEEEQLLKVSKGDYAVVSGSFDCNERDLSEAESPGVNNKRSRASLPPAASKEQSFKKVKLLTPDNYDDDKDEDNYSEDDAESFQDREISDDETEKHQQTDRTLVQQQ
jgi:hypothetical protein